MRTMAQMVCEMTDQKLSMIGGRTPKIRREWSGCVHNLATVRQRLLPPTPEELRGKTALHDVRQSASRFSFETDPTVMVDRLVRGGSLTTEVVALSARLPSSCLWLEWREEQTGSLVGYLIEKKDEEWWIVMHLCEVPDQHGRNEEGLVLPIAGAMVKAPERIDGKALTHVAGGWMLQEDTAGKDLISWIKFMTMEMLAAVFLLSVPRICEIRSHVASQKLQRARARRGKPPLIEIRRVKLVVGVGSPRYQRESAGASGAGSRRRFHEVIGHVRTYHADSDKPLVTYVPEHWRGDPKLGVVIHDRRVESKR